VQGGREVVIDREVGTNSVAKSTGKLCTVIGGDNVRYASLANHVFEDPLWVLWGVNVLSAGEVDRHFSQTVDDYQDPGISRCR
jgi:hypothetical protein